MARSQRTIRLMLTALRRSSRRALAAAGRKIAAPAALRLYRRPDARADAEVHMLVSSRTWDAGLLAACSLERHSGRRWPFVFHDDGSLSNEACERIAEVFPDARCISRHAADGRSGQFLAGHPKCLAHRSNHNLFLKFFDFFAFAEGERFVVLDSDVIFFRRPAALVDWLDANSRDAFYNEDTKEKYCIPRGKLVEGLGLEVWPRFNSGLVLLPRAAANLDLAERLLTTFEANAHHPQFFEQTLYAVTASAWGRGGALPREYEISWGYLKRRDAVCRHYVGEFKHDLLFIEGAPLLLASILKKRFLGLS